MRILLIGANGTVGGVIRRELGPRHEIVGAGRTHGDLSVDITDTMSILAMYKSVGQVDAVVCAAGDVHFGALAHMTRADFQFGVTSKLMGQVDVVLQGAPFVSPNGSFTLTSGITARKPVPGFVNASAVNAALIGFVLGAAIEMQRGQRINVVSPGLLGESAERYADFFPGHVPVAGAVVALAYAKSVEGGITGQTLNV